MNMKHRRKRQRNSQRGSGLIELMIAMVVLAIGLGGATTLLVTAIASNHRNNTDTTAVLLAQKVIEQISAQNVYADTVVNVTDCAGNQFLFSTDPGAVGTGFGAQLTANGTIDFTQPLASVPAGYAMTYVACSTQGGGLPAAFDVRWNVMNVSANSSVRLITAAARPTAGTVNQLGGLYFSIPVNLRGSGGPNIGE